MDISIKYLCQLSLSSDYTDNKDTRQGDENATIVYDNDFDGNADEEYDDDAHDDESNSNSQEDTSHSPLEISLNYILQFKMMEPLLTASA